MRIGYTPASTDDHDLAPQTHELRRAGRERISSEKAAGWKSVPPSAETWCPLREGPALAVRPVVAFLAEMTCD